LSEKHLIAAIVERFRELSAGERRRKIRRLAEESVSNDRFIRKYFPEFYAEAYPTASFGAGASSESEQRPSLAARPR